MDSPRIAIIVPSYRAFTYCRNTLLSLFHTLPSATAIVVDDASPDWKDGWYDDIKGDIRVHKFPKNGGLTRSWNKGFQIARDIDCDYIVAGNNDVLFAEGWWRGLAAVLVSPYRLAGPLSNAPGVTAAGLQNITRYVENYALTDTAEYLNRVSNQLWETYGGRGVPANVNGFFTMAKKEDWFSLAYDDRHVFRPVNRIMPSGIRNRTPLMTGNEDELQSRWKIRGAKPIIALGSFIFHYRSVSRGRRHTRGKWMRFKTHYGE